MTPNGTAIRAIRAAQGRSLRSLADEAGISASFLGQVERGEKPASDDAVTRIARALDVPTDAITREGNPVNTAPEEDEVRLYTIAEAAVLIRMSAGWVKRAVAARAIPCTFVGLGAKKSVRFTLAHIRAIAAENEVVPPQYAERLAKTA